MTVSMTEKILCGTVCRFVNCSWQYQGAKPVDVAARLGHTDATITQNLYTHDTEEMKKETARIFEWLVDK